MRHYVDALVHPSARQDALTAARHRAFIAPRLLGGVAALVTFPIYLAARGLPSVLEVGVFAWLATPILLAYFLSRTGRYESAHVLSSLALTGLVAVVTWYTGGIGSFAAIWLVVVPLEAALSASRRVVATASTFALAAAGFLAVATQTGLTPQAATVAAGHASWIALGIISAALYATGLALGAESLARTSFWLLYAEEDRYRLLARNMTDVIARYQRNGTALFVSPAAHSLFGVAATELTGHGLFDRVHVADRPAYLSALADAASGGEARSVEFRIRRDDSRANKFVWVEMRCRLLDQETAEAASREVVAVLRDVSERKAQEQALEEARAESERANAGKSRFLATMSHELRTPLNAIIGFSDMLTNEAITLDSARRDEYARLINNSGRHLLSVVNGILDMSKMEAGNFEITPEPFAPGQVISGCCDLLALKARESGIDLKTRLAANLPEIVADRRALSQILLNLVSNALKFTNRGGTVVVAAERQGAQLCISIEDTGVGIGEEDLPRLGEAFFQARSSYDRRHDGTGLGLSIVKGLVRLHGGEFTIASKLGEGTCVTVRIPIDCEHRRPPVQPIDLKRKNEEVPAHMPADNRVRKSA
ncbi:MAG: PAS domain-containing sensor histidine kinase [Pseudolabrys sp.]|nr:PAS domain-containing sensor histidine kinase [Pseudolabrys sp.]